MASVVTGSTKTWGASVATASGRIGPAAAIRAIEPPSLWPTSTGRSMPSAASTAGSSSRAARCMKSADGGVDHGVERP